MNGSYRIYDYKNTVSTINTSAVSAMDEKLIQFAMTAIVLHLKSHPGSADTLEGVHQWWVVWPDIQESIFVTAEALHRLQEANLVEVRSVGERELWRLPREASR